METFVTTNGILMTPGELFNWRIEPKYRNQPEPFSYLITMGGWNNHYGGMFEEDEQILSIFSYDEDGGSFKFACSDLHLAELIVNSFMKGNDFDITGTIYDKQAEHSA